MDIRNLMEDRVIRLVNEICDEEEKKTSQRYCTSSQCRLDAACFALNRIPQRYVTSGRGFAHLETDLQENQQLQVDMVTLVHEGLQRVTSFRRTFYGDEEGKKEQLKESQYYFFHPTIKGRIFNGLTFEPLVEVAVTLTIADQVVTMIDSRWPNPYTIVVNAPGTYLFWPRPTIAEKANIEQCFEMCISVNNEFFEPLKHYINIPVHSEPYREPKSIIRDFTVSDLFLLPRSNIDHMQFNPADDPA